MELEDTVDLFIVPIVHDSTGRTLLRRAVLEGMVGPEIMPNLMCDCQP